MTTPERPRSVLPAPHLRCSRHIGSATVRRVLALAAVGALLVAGAAPEARALQATAGPAAVRPAGQASPAHQTAPAATEPAPASVPSPPHVAARLAPELRAALAAAAPGERFPVSVVLTEALPTARLQEIAGTSERRERRRLVAGALRTHAAARQTRVRALVQAAVDAGEATLRHDLWIGNALVLDAGPALIAQLAALPEVDRIHLIHAVTPAEVQDAFPVAPPAPAATGTPVAARLLPAAPGGALALQGGYPFYDDFESGSLLPHWSVATTGSGYASVSPANGPRGGFHCLMATSVNSVDSIASITVELDLAGQNDVGVRFRHKEFGDENHPEDGVAVSVDGVTWFEVVSLQNASQDYTSHWVTLDPLLPGFGIGFTSSFLVRFQWRDNFDIPSDGFAFDEIEIGPGVGVEPAPEIEPHVTALQAPLVWDRGYRGDGVLIGTIDSGTFWQHPDLVHRVWSNPGEIASNLLDDDGNGFVDDIQGWDFETNDNNIVSGDAHGTYTAGLMVGDGSKGKITGVAPGAGLVVCKVSTEADYWAAQQYLLDVGVDVVSSSYSYKWPAQPDYHMFRQIAEVELAAGIVHANSIGNQAVLQNTHPIPFNVSTPGNCPSPFAHPQAAAGGRSAVMGCGGIQIDDTLYNPSGRGPSAWEDLLLYDPSWPHPQDSAYWDYPVGGFGGGQPGLIKPDVVAYTNTVMTTNVNAGYIAFTGTSASTPQLGGAMAVLLDLQPHALPRHIAAALELSAKDLGPSGKDNDFGAGRIRLFDAARRLVWLARFSTQQAGLGDPFDIEVFGLPNDTVYGFYSAGLVTNTGELNLGQPLHYLGLRFTDAQGEAVWHLAVPNNPILVGLTVWFQAAAEADGAWGAGPYISVPDSLTVTQ